MKTVIPCKISFSKTDKCWYVESPGFYDGYLTYGNSLDEAKKNGKRSSDRAFRIIS